MKVNYLFNGSCENQIDIYRECYYLLNITWFGRVSLSQKILEAIGRSEIGLKFWWSVLVPFLYKGLSFATLQSFGKWDSLMDKLQICVMRMTNIGTIFQKSTRYVVPAALLTLHDFRRLVIVFGWTVWKFSLLWLNSDISL